MNKPKGKPKKRVQKEKSTSSGITLKMHESGIRKRNEFAMEGVRILPLSRITQKVIGCIVGETVTTEDPWTYVKKEKIEDNIELHEESSEFLSIKKEIEKYPDEDMLIGVDLSIMDKPEFLICVTKEAKENVLRKIDQIKHDMDNRMLKSVHKEARPWVSLGSEIDIDDDLPKNFRVLYEINIETRYPVCSDKVKFSERTASDAYMELLPERYTGRNVIRERVSRSMQASPQLATSEAQTIFVYPMNQSTQYNYEYNEPELKLSDFEKLNEFFDSRVDDICDNIQVNGNINLYEDDYEYLVRRKLAAPILDHREVLLLQDVIFCKGMKISSMSWHPLISGLLAVAYVKAPHTHIYTEPPPVPTIEETTFTNNLVLIWSYSDNLKPKLYLHAEREVTTISFCEFNPNILAGGMRNGQVVLWDITGRLEQVETRKIFTQKERKHSLIIRNLMDWMKFIDSDSTIYSTLISDLDYGHVGAVTNLHWLSTKYEITSIGKIIQPTVPNLQFITSGTDGYIYVWDLNQSKVGENFNKTTLAKKNRLGTRPSALRINLSPLSHMNKVLRPHYRFVAEHPVLKLKLPINNLTFKSPEYEYIALNPETLPNITERTYFKLDYELPFECVPQFMIGTSIGFHGLGIWEGFDFNPGRMLNTETCKITPFLGIHDGPIRCSVSPFFPHIFLTLGGRVFAIWDSKYPEQPIQWRKSKHRYIFAVWSRYDPSLVIATRFDSHFELWDITTLSKLPSSTQKLSGNAFIDGSTELYKTHVRKCTIGICDLSGALKIYHLHDSFTRNQPKKLMLVKQMFEVSEKRYEVLKKWRADWILNNIVQPEVEEVDEANVYQMDQEDEVKLVVHPKLKPAEVFAMQNEKFMHQTLLQKKKLNIVEIERQKKPLERLRKEARIRLKREKNMIGQKHKIFETQKNVVIKEAELQHRPLITIALPTDQETVTKCKYLTAFKESEQRALAFIKKHPYRHRFDWKEMIIHCKNRLPKTCKLKKITISRMFGYVEKPDNISDEDASSDEDDA